MIEFKGLRIKISSLQSSRIILIASIGGTSAPSPQEDLLPTFSGCKSRSTCSASGNCITSSIYSADFNCPPAIYVISGPSLATFSKSLSGNSSLPGESCTSCSEFLSCEQAQIVRLVHLAPRIDVRTCLNISCIKKKAFFLTIPES